VYVILVDIISSMGFEKSGNHLAVGDRGGRVVIFERKDGKDVRIELHSIGGYF
jgi:serine/threonine-protein phosphatase 2A regulatory subunit B